MKRIFGLLAFALAVAASSVQPTVALAAGASAECSKADAMMSAAMSHGAGMKMAGKPTGKVDKDFALAMMTYHNAMIAMAKMEIKCGTNDIAKAEAQKFIDNSAAFSTALMSIEHTP